ncbi:MAG: glycosyltransferase family 39 protein [Chloroflexi bacterium]|nr:glycosyltransferase family 39 protein [Chloroflexota bacterium]
MTDAARSQSGPNSRRIQNCIALALIAFFIVFGILSVQKVSVTADEALHYRYGMQILNLNSKRFDDSKMPVTALNALPKKIASYLPGGPLNNFLSDFFTARLMTILFSALVAYVVFHWARELYGFYAGLAALVLYIFDPNIIANSQLVTTDIYVTGTILFATYGVWKFANTRRVRDGVLSAFTLGLSEIAKYTSIVLLPLFALALVLHDLPAQISAFKENGLKAIGKYLGQLVLYTAAGCLSIFVIVNAAFLFNRTFVPLNQYVFQSHFFRRLQNVPVVQNLRVPFPYPYLQGLDRTINNEQTGKSFGNIYLLGQIRSGHGFAGYYFVASALKVPIATLLVILIAFIVYAVSKKRRQTFLQDEVFLFVPFLFYTIYFNFFYDAQIGFRYYMVVFPLLYVFAGSLFSNWPEFSRKQKTAVFALAVYLIGSVLSYYPFYLSYFNEIVWDRRYAYKYLADSNLDWGQGQVYLSDYLAAHPNAIYTPGGVTSGEIIVGASDLVGVTTWGNPDKYKWLRDNFQPTKTIAYEYLVFDITPQQLHQLCLTTNYCH